MKFKFIILVILSITYFLFSQDTNKIYKINNLDTIFIPVPTDSMHFTVKSKEYIPKLNWWRRNEASLLGALVGAIAAGLIAFLSVKITFRKAKKLENEKLTYIRREKENIYCGLLFMIFSELFGNDQDTPRLKKEIDEFLKIVRDYKDIISETPFTLYNVDSMKICQEKILQYDFFNTEILTLLSHYLNIITRLNKYLDLRKVKEVRVHFKENEDNFVKAVEGYFEEVNDIISRLEKVRKSLEESIMSEIKRYPQSDIDVENLKEKLGMSRKKAT